MMDLMGLKKQFSSDIEAINDTMTKALHACDIPDLVAIYDYVQQKKGKQVRSLMVMLVGSLVSHPPHQSLYYLGACVDLIHLASLIHDDIIDDASDRRSQASLYKRFGLNKSLIVGIHCYSLALKLGVKTNSLSVVQCLSDAVKYLCEGEFKQMNERYNIQLPIPEYWDIVHKKTSSLFVAALEASAILCEVSPIIRQKIAMFGRIFGDIFQLTDDYLDMYGTHDTLSKKVKQDLVTGDISLAMILAGQFESVQTMDDLSGVLTRRGHDIQTHIKAELTKKDRQGHDYLDAIQAEGHDVTHLRTLLRILTNRIN